MIRALALSTALFAAAIAFGGLIAPELDPTENAAAECGHVSLDGDPCPPSLGCLVAQLVTEHTRGPSMVCTM